MGISIRQILTRRTTILDRYLFKEFLGPFVLAIGGFAIIAMVDILFWLVEWAVKAKISFITVGKLLVYKLPAVMILFFPMAVLFSTMLLLVRMAKDNELTVLRTSGVHVGRIIIPLIILGVMTGSLSYVTNEKIVPWTNRASELLIRHELQRKPPPTVAENVVFKDPLNRFFYIRKIDSKIGEMQDILIFDQTGTFPRITTAEIAVWDKKTWTLLQGQSFGINDKGAMDSLTNFSEMKLHVDQDVESFYTRQKSAKEMDSKELRERIETLSKGGISTRSLRVEYHMKKSVPAACFVFLMVGTAYCLSFVRSGKDWWGVIISICISVLTVGLYFFIVAVFRALAIDGTISALWGAWIPNMIYLGVVTPTILYQVYYK